MDRFSMVSALVCACLSAGQNAIVGSMTPLVYAPQYSVDKKLIVDSDPCDDLKDATNEFIKLTGITCKES